MTQKHSNPGRFPTSEESARIADAIAAAEGRTSAEIKVVILGHCWTDIRDKAARLFRKLGLEKTRDRNCIMLLVVVADREFLIYGDKGIHERVGQGFWDGVRDAMASRFAQGRPGEAVVHGIEEAGKMLAEHFPHKPDNRNEIPDEVTVK